MPLKGARYRFRQIDRNNRQRLAFIGDEVVEVVNFKKEKGRWVKVR